MNNSPENLEDLEQLREKYKRLLREFKRVKDENRPIKSSFVKFWTCSK